MTITATRPASAPVSSSAASAAAPASAAPVSARPADDAKEQARRALQVSLDTRQ